MRHQEDAGKPGLKVFTDPHDAIEIARYDDDGKYRPLKTAPNLRHDWQLQLNRPRERRIGVGFSLSRRIGNRLGCFTQARLRTVNLRHTLARQTGMYAVVRKSLMSRRNPWSSIPAIMSDGCLRHILWSISPHRRTSLSRLAAEAQPSENEIPVALRGSLQLAGRRRAKDAQGGDVKFSRSSIVSGSM